VLMDIRMPRIDGLEATARLAQDMPALRIIILSTFDNDEYVYRALTAGASGFLLKSTPPTRLIDGVRLAVSGEALLAPSITRRMIEEWVRRPAPGAGPSPRLDPLTQRELEVLTQIGRGAHQPHPCQTRPPRPRPSGRVRIRVWPRDPRRSDVSDEVLQALVSRLAVPQCCDQVPRICPGTWSMPGRTCRARPEYARIRA
jgi:CheY-like chemotaxis protein